MHRTRHVRPLAALLLLTAPLQGLEGPLPAPARDPFTVAGILQAVDFREIASGLGFVTSVVNAGDNRLFITERTGRVFILEGGRRLAEPFLDIRSQITTEGEGGLLSIAFHPRYAENGFFFANYTNRSGDTVIARFQVSSDPNRADAGSARTLLVIDQPFSNHNGGQIQFGPDGHLYIGMGDGGAAFDPACRAQRDETLLGKMLRLDVNQNVNTAPFHGIPADNPFRGAGGPLDEIWASGLRNPWRFSFDRQTGDLWIADVGQGEREEVNFQPATSDGGENYGWKPMEGSLCSSRDACPASVPACDSAAFTLPVLEYTHSAGCSITGGYVYRGSLAPLARGMYFFGDFCSGTVWAAARQGDGFTVRRLGRSFARIITFGEDRNGELHLATNDGRLYRLEGGASPVPPERVGLYDPRDSRFHLKNTNGTGSAAKRVRFGPRNNDWTPLAGDWNGDSKATIGFYDPDANTFRLKNSQTGGAADIVLTLPRPSASAVPLVGDWDGDGDDTVGFYDLASDQFFLINSLAGGSFDITGTFTGAPSGTLIPVVGDWDRDGRDTIGLYNPATSVFLLSNSLTNARPDLQFTFGTRNGQPVIGDWNGDGLDGIGVYDQRTGTFRLRNQPNAGAADFNFRFGNRRAGWQPLAGAW